MEENNKLQQNHSGNTPPPVPQPASPPPFVAPDGDDETCGQNVQKSQEESTPQEESSSQEEAPAAPTMPEGAMPSPAQMERLMEEADRELEAFDAKPLPNAGLLVRAFSFKGRITRAEYLISHALIPFHFMLVAYVANVASEIASFSIGEDAAGSLYNRLMLFSGLFMFCWFYTAQGVKRCHDVGWSGWWFYVPFINIPLFFKKTRRETNRYGLPATLRATNAEDAAAATLVRRRGIWCAATWLLCSPVYLFLTWRWKIQRLFARLLMLLVSPFIISVGYTSQVAYKQAKIARTHEARAIGFLSESNLGVALPVDEAEWRGRERFSGADTYDIFFSKALTDRL